MMPYTVYESPEELARDFAACVAAVFRDKPNGVLGTATGSSPLEVYRVLGRLVEIGAVSLKNVRTFQLDEYVGLPVGHEQSSRTFIEENLVALTDLNSANVAVPNPHLVGDPGIATLDDAAAAYDLDIKAAGGVDFQILGIGSDGHIAFNEPGTPLDSRTHVADLAPQTIADNARFFGGDQSQVPTQCITQGLGTIMEARAIGLIAMGENKAQAVYDMIHGPVSPDCPASVLQNHPDVRAYLDAGAAKLL